MTKIEKTIIEEFKEKLSNLDLGVTTNDGEEWNNELGEENTEILMQFLLSSLAKQREEIRKEVEKIKELNNYSLDFDGKYIKDENSPSNKALDDVLKLLKKYE